MPRMTSDQEIYARLGGLFDALLADAKAGPKLRALGATVQWQLRRPDAQITLKLPADGEAEVVCGATELRPDVVLVAETETVRRFWIGELALHVALANGQIRAKGPVATILALVPLVPIAKAIGMPEAAAEEPAAAAIEKESAAPDEPGGPAGDEEPRAEESPGATAQDAS